MPISQTISYTFNDVVTSALRAWLKTTPVEQNYTTTPLLNLLEKDRETPAQASYWHVPVGNVGNPLGGPFELAGSTPTTGSDDVTLAQYRRCQYAEPVLMFFTDEWDTSSGEVALFKKAARATASARMRQRTDLATDLVSTSSVTSGLQGLPLAAEEAPSSSGAYGNISGNTYSWWRNQTDASSPSFATGGMPALESMATSLMNVEGEGDPFDWICVSTNVFGFIQTAARTFLSLNAPVTGGGGKRVAEMGWPALNFHGKPIFNDPRLTAGYAYFGGSGAAKLMVDPNNEFRLGNFSELTPGGQHGRIAYMYWRGQFVTFNRPRLGQISTITA